MTGQPCRRRHDGPCRRRFAGAWMNGRLSPPELGNPHLLRKATGDSQPDNLPPPFIIAHLLSLLLQLPDLWLNLGSDLEDLVKGERLACE